MYITDDAPKTRLVLMAGDGDNLSSRTVFLLSRMSPFIRRCAGAARVRSRPTEIRGKACSYAIPS